MAFHARGLNVRPYRYRSYRLWGSCGLSDLRGSGQTGYGRAGEPLQEDGCRREGHFKAGHRVQNACFFAPATKKREFTVSCRERQRKNSTWSCICQVRWREYARMFRVRGRWVASLVVSLDPRSYSLGASDHGQKEISGFGKKSLYLTQEKKYPAFGAFPAVHVLGYRNRRCRR